MESRAKFRIGNYRPIYLWAGPGTIRMNRVKFMDQPVDEDAHHLAHDLDGAKRVVDELKCNWVHLTYNWGFPPEIETVDWDDFTRAAKNYHDLGAYVYAYIQSSNCVFTGSFREREWYAKDYVNRKVFYYSGRYMTCLLNPEWTAYLKDMVKGAIERGADGIFFDNLWFGDQAISLFNTWLGVPGCHCEICKQKFSQQHGIPIPSEIVTNDERSNTYLHWRATQVTQLIADLVDYARELKPDIVISANDFDPITRPSYVVYGIDINGLANLKDVSMIENFALPHWAPAPKSRLANNALTLRNARTLINKDTHLSVLSYDVGIGFDPIYPIRRYLQGIAEAAACGASMTIKGTEYFHDGKHTLLITDQFNSLREKIGDYHDWLVSNQELYQGRRNAAPIGLFFPGEILWFEWHARAQRYFAAGQALTMEGLPWRVVTDSHDVQDLAVMLNFESDLKTIDRKHIQIIQTDDLPGWKIPPASFLSRHPRLRELIARSAHSLLRAYHGNLLARRLMDGLGLPKLITQTPLFNIPDHAVRMSLISKIQEDVFPKVMSPEPVLIDVWKRGDEMQVHLVNYNEAPQSIQVIFNRQINGYAKSPDLEDDVPFQGRIIDLIIDIYTVLILPNQN